MKDASQALNSGLVFSSSSRKCQVFKMIYCHGSQMGRRETWKWSEGRLGAGLRQGAWVWWPAVGPSGSPTAALGLGLHFPRMELRDKDVSESTV